jgi:hypothetical protein
MLNRQKEDGIIKRDRCAKPGKMQFVAISRSVLPTEMLLCILLTCLASILARQLGRQLEDRE